ncbi:GNAT family N-acetyltransferase [Kitasatospora sp. KL5]|uniref:GNAT family N-acetyltransferase n=1 Tax=Kitasatospora sp. KL5 TaxID=3425125 RepID=UPI003D6E0DEE
MADIIPLPDRSTWLSGYLRRLTDSYRAGGLEPAAAEQLAAEAGGRTEGWTVAGITEDGRTVGFVAVGLDDRNGSPVGRIGELWTEPGREGLRPAALHWAERWCAERGGHRVEVLLAAPDPLFEGYAVRGQARVKTVTTAAGPRAEGPAGAERVGPSCPSAGKEGERGSEATEHGGTSRPSGWGRPSAPGREGPEASGREQGTSPGVTSRPMTAEEYPAWRAQQDAAYVADMVRAGSYTEQEARAKSAADFSRLLPREMDTEGNAFLVLEAGGETVGTGWLKHGFLPGVTFGYSLDVLPEHRGRGFGRAAMAVGEQAVLAAGDRALLLNVFGGNEVAMGLYTSAGYTVLEERRSRDVSGAP